MIELKHIGKVYHAKGGDLEALKDINLSIEEGEIYGIIGLSGAGKSTLVRCINMLEQPTSGEVIVDGRDMTKLSKMELRKARQEIGMIFQHFNLLSSRTVYDNIAFPLEIQGKSRDEIRKKVEPLLDLVGLTDRRDHYPSQLSGGQKQRVGIARALASDPKVLLCDEATSALDPQTTESILELLRDISKRLHIRIVMITHQMNVIEEICHRVAILDHGVIAEQGSVEDIFSHPQTDIGRRLVYPNGVQIDRLPEARVIRIAFNGGSSYEPLIASLAIDCGVKANILGADPRNIGGRAFGTMLLGLPEDEQQAAAAMAYLTGQKDITVEEVRDYHD